LYRQLLGREGSSGEIAGWVNALLTAGRAGVAAGFLHSAEYRTAEVQVLYGFTDATSSWVNQLPNLLHRIAAPSGAEVSGWVNSGLDILNLEAMFAASSEYVGRA
jgi:hypothetical protein